MVAGIIGKKLGMTQLFREDGKMEAVTALEAGPCAIIQVKKTATDGYNAVQLGFGSSRKLKSAEKGHLKGLGTFRYLKEFRVNEADTAKVGDKLDVSLFKIGDKVDITGVSKSKGNAGVVKRHHFKGGPKTHGQSDRHRHPGAIGSTTYPGRLWPGLRMAGRMGGEQITIRRLEVRGTDAERNLLLVKGAVPGAVNGLILIRKSGKGA